MELNGEEAGHVFEQWPKFIKVSPMGPHTHPTIICLVATCIIEIDILKLIRKLHFANQYISVDVMTYAVT